MDSSLFTKTRTTITTTRPIPPLIVGGQGRTAESVRQDAAGLVTLLVGALSGAVVVAAVWVVVEVLR